MQRVGSSLNYKLSFIFCKCRIINHYLQQTRMYSRIEGNGSIKLYIALYCFSFVCHGLFSCNIGPLIPYLADKLNKEQTDFSFLFFARTIGSVIGISAYRYLQSKSTNLDEHKLLAAFSFLSALPMLFFVSWQSNVGEWISMIIIGAGTFGLNTLSNVCLLFISINNPRWLTFGHACFGIGAFLAPFIIMRAELDMFYINFVCYSVLAASCLFIKTPKLQTDNDRTQDSQATRQSEDSQATRQSEGGQKIILKQGSVKLQILVSLSLFLIVAVQSIFLGWISTYAVVTEVCSKKQATIYVSIFWITSTIFRFMNAALKVRSSLKLKCLLGSTLMSGILCLGLHLGGYASIAALMAAILLGFSCSAVYPINLAVPNEYGIKFRKQEITNIMSSTVLSSLLISLTGELMRMDISFLFDSFIVMSLLQIITAAMMFKRMVRQAKKGKEIKSIQIGEYIIQ